MVPHVNSENLQKPMQKHHPVVENENGNLYRDHIFVILQRRQYTLPGDKKINGLNDIDGVCYLLPFS